MDRNQAGNRPEADDPSLQAEIEAALGDLDSDDWLMDMPGEGVSAPRSFLAPGEKVAGTIVQVTAEDVFVELGPKQQGVCPLSQFEPQPEVGSTQRFSIVRYDRSEQLFYLSRVGQVQKAEWEYVEEGQVVEAICTGTNKGGLDMTVAGHRAFLPAGQASVWRVENLEDLVGQKMACEIIELDRRSGNMVLSRRVVLERELEEKKKETWELLEVGQVRTGTVRKLMPFGAFVDLGGVDGLIHISDLSYSRLRDPAEIVHEGQTVTVQVLKLDPERQRVGLGMKQCEADPFQSTVESIKVGDTITGRITKIADFGAFVEIQPGVEGLIHISELSSQRVGRVAQVVQSDQIVSAVVLEIDTQTRRIALSMRALALREETEMERPADRALARLRARHGRGEDLKGGLG